MLSILVAERDGDFRRKIKTILQDTYIVFEADNGIEAIDISNREAISLYLINCETPRPQICTREFRPVCGLKGGELYKTYSTACDACSHKEVTRYYKGVCK